jgi:hypothetical protein
LITLMMILLAAVTLMPLRGDAAPGIVSVRSELVREAEPFWEKIRGPLRANEITKFDEKVAMTMETNPPGHNFRVRWNAEELAGKPVELRMVYRQKSASRPSVLKSIVEKPGKRNNETLFRVTGERFEEFGPVTAWRIEIWSNGQLLTQKLGPNQRLLLMEESKDEAESVENRGTVREE